MKSYLSQIATRANGTPAAAAIKPVTQLWPVSPLEEVNPFVEIIEPPVGTLTQELSPDADRQFAQSEIRNSQHTASVRDAHEHSEFPRPEASRFPGQTARLENSSLQPSEHVISPDSPAYWESSPTNIPSWSRRPSYPSQESLPKSTSRDAVILLRPSDEEDRSLNIDAGQPVPLSPHPPPNEESRSTNADQTIAERRPDLASRNSEPAGEFSYSENSTSVRPSAFENRGIHNELPLPNQQIERATAKQEVQEPDPFGFEPVQQSSAEPLSSLVSTFIRKEGAEMSRSNDELVQQLRPTPPIDSTSPPVQNTTDTEQRLVIGRLSVEVVTPPPVMNQQTTFRPTRRAVRGQPRHEGSRYRSKLRFGLGQI